MIAALDSPPWAEYDTAPVLEFMTSSKKRSPFRYPRSDKGGTHKRKAKAPLAPPCASSSTDLNATDSSSSDDNQDVFLIG